MSLTSFLSKIFGNKSTCDLKEIQPIVDQIKALGPEMEAKSNDELRQTITDIRADIAAAVADDEKAKADLRAELETLPFEKRQPLWDDIDRHEKAVIDTIEEKLNTHLPTVFAALRETAARFAKAPDGDIIVTATQMDRDLAAQGRDFVTIDGDRAIWHNHWKDRKSVV